MTRSDERQRWRQAPGLRLERALRRVFGASGMAVAQNIRVAHPSHVVTVTNTGTSNSSQVAGAAQRVQIRQIGGEHIEEANHG